MKNSTYTRAAIAAVIAAALAIGVTTACTRDKAAEAASKNAADQPRLFSIPADQLSHIQVVTVQPTTLERVLRLPGTVAYNGFTTTPVIS